MADEVGVRLSLRGRREFSADVDRARRDVNDLGDEIKKTDRKADAASRGGVGRLSGALKGGLAGAAKIGLTAVAGLTVGIGALGAKTIGLAMDAGETASKFNTVFAGMEEQVGGFVRQMNTDYGIPTKDLQDAAATFGVFGKAAGVAKEDLASFSTDLVSAGTDMASFYNAPVEDVFLALRSGLSGESEPLRKFGIFLSDASLNAYALEKGIGKTTKEMSDQEKVALRQSFILAKMGDAEGDLARTSDSLSNKTKALKGRFTEAGTAIGTAFLPFAEKMANALDDKLGPAVAEMTRTAPMVGDAFKAAFAGDGVTTELFSLVGIAERAGVAFNWLRNQYWWLADAFEADGPRGAVDAFDTLVGAGGLLTDTFDALSSIVDSLGTIWTDLLMPVLTDFNNAIPRGIRPIEVVAKGLEWVAENGEALQPILAGLLGGFIAFKVVTGIIQAATKAQAIWNAVMGMNPIGLVVIALAALAAGLVYAYQNSETFRDIVDGAFQTVLGVVTGVWNWISDNWPLLLAILTGPFGIAVLAISRNFEKIKGVVGGVLNWIIDKWNGFEIKLPSFDGLEVGGVTVIPGWEGPTLSTPNIPRIGGVTGSGTSGRNSAGVGGNMARMHTGGTTGTGGSTIIRPDEEAVVLPPAAKVIPLPAGERINLADTMKRQGGGGWGDGDIVIEIDGKEILRATKTQVKNEAARR